jgi:hypothetical protein
MINYLLFQMAICYIVVLIDDGCQVLPLTNQIHHIIQQSQVCTFSKPFQRLQLIKS